MQSGSKYLARKVALNGGSASQSVYSKDIFDEMFSRLSLKFTGFFSPECFQKNVFLGKLLEQDDLKGGSRCPTLQKSTSKAMMLFLPITINKQIKATDSAIC